MAFAGMNYWAILAATLASMLIGFGWYGILGRFWMHAAELTPELINSKGGGKRGRYIAITITLVCQFIMATMLAGVIGHLGPDQVNIRNGLISGFFVWLGFVMTTMLVNHRFQASKPMLSVIDGGHWLAVLFVQGAIIGLFGI